MSREVWQGDVLIFIKKNIPNVQNKDFQALYMQIENGANLPSSRISEILNAIKNNKDGKHLGRDEFLGKEELFYNSFFKGQNLDVIYNKLSQYIKDEKIVYPNAEKQPDDTNEEYILRFLTYGLANAYVPNTAGGLSVVSSDQAAAIHGGGILPESETTVPVKTEDVTNKKTAETERSFSNKIHVYFGKNWLLLTVGFAITLSIFLYMSYTNTSMTDILLEILNVPAQYFIAFIILLAVFPKIIGMVEASLVNVSYRNKVKSSGEFVKIAKYGAEDTVIPGKGVFDASSANLQYGLLSNITGALCTAAFYVFSSSLDGMDDFIRSHPVNSLLIILILGSVCISIIWNFMLQIRHTPESPDEVTENPDNYLLSRLHVLATIVHLVFTLAFDGTIILYLFWYGFNNRILHLSLPISFIGIIGTLFLYLCVASISPPASTLNVDCRWFIHLIPVMSLITLFYAIYFFQWSINTMMCIVANIMCLSFWLYYLNKER